MRGGFAQEVVLVLMTLKLLYLAMLGHVAFPTSTDTGDLGSPEVLFEGQYQSN